MPRKKEASPDVATAPAKPAKKTRAKRGPYGQQATKRISLALKTLCTDSEHLASKLPHLAIAADLHRAVKNAKTAWDGFYANHAAEIATVERPARLRAIGTTVMLVGPNLAQAAILHGKDVAKGPWKVVGVFNAGQFLTLESLSAAGITTAIPGRSATPDAVRAKAAQASVLSKLQ